MHPTRPSLIRGSTVRFALVYLALFGVSATGLLAFVYTTTVGVIGHQIDQTIEAEIGGLAEQYRQNGLVGLRRTIERRSAGSPGRRSIYLLAGPGFVPVAGNLSDWPPDGRGAGGWIDFPIQTAEGGVPRRQVARARTFLLAGGFHLLVGRDMTERAEFGDRMTGALIGALALSVLFGAAGGILMSRNLLRRIDAINRSSADILRGDLKRRMPVSGNSDEFDRLAGNLNAMLDRIVGLMGGMRTLADSIAHDLRSPIARLRSRLEVTLLGKPDVDAYRDALERSVAETDSILETFSAVLAISLAESRALRDAFEETDLAVVVADAADLYEPLTDERNQTLEVAADPGLTVLGNPSLLAQAVVNLLDNAFKYTPDGGTIALTARRGVGGSEIVVADDGPGIPPQSREQALRRFGRLDRSRHTPGAGLGLSLVAAVADLHDATLSLDDNDPGLKVVLKFEDGSNP